MNIIGLFAERLNDAFEQNPTLFIIMIGTFTLLIVLGFEYRALRNNQVNRQVSSRLGDGNQKFQFFENVIDYIFRKVERNEDKVVDTLRQANVLFTVKEYHTFTLIGLGAGVLIGLLLSPLAVVFDAILKTAPFAVQQVFGRVGSAALLGIAGMQFPKLWLKFLIYRRKKLLQEQIQDSLLNIADALKSGHVIQEAIRIVGVEMPYPIGPEFERAYREMETGKTFEAALGDLKTRIDLPDFTMAVNAMEIQYEVGGKLEPLLRNMVKIITERSELRKEIEKTIAGSKTVGIVLLAAPWFFIVVFTMLNKQQYLDMLKNPIGIFMLLIGLVCYIIAAWLIVYIIKQVSKED